MKDRWGVSLDPNAKVCVRLSAQWVVEEYIYRNWQETSLRWGGRARRMSPSSSLAPCRCLKVLSCNAETLLSCSTEFLVTEVRNNTVLQAAFLSSATEVF
jgi:hypothetical protein